MRRLLLGLVLMTTTLSRDTLTGGDAASLDGRVPDGGGVPTQATGTYERDNNLGTPGTDEIAIAGGLGVALGPDGARYGLTGIPSLPAIYRTIAEFLFPNRVSLCGDCTVGLTSVTDDGFTGGDDPDVDGRSLDGGPGSWANISDQYGSPDSLLRIKSGILTDGSHNTTPLESGGVYRIDGSGIADPTACAVRITGVSNDSPDADVVDQRWGVGIVAPTLRAGRMAYAATVNDHGVVTLGRWDNVAGVVTGITGVSGPSFVTTQGTSHTLTVLVFCGTIYAFFDNDLQCSMAMDSSTDYTDWVPQVFVNSDGNGPGATLDDPPLVEVSHFEAFDAMCGVGTPYFDVPAAYVGSGDVYAAQEVMVKWDKATSTGYLLRTEVIDALGVPQLFYYLQEWDAGVPTGLRSSPGLIPSSYDTPLSASLEYNAGVLYARDSTGALIWNNGSGQTFDLAVDLADDTAALVTDHTTGDPGFGALDGTGLFIAITEHRVEGEACAPGTPAAAGEVVVASDQFTTSTGFDADIAGRMADGGGGLWAKHATYQFSNEFWDIAGGALVTRRLGNFYVYRLGPVGHDIVESVVTYPSGASLGLCNASGQEGPQPLYVNSGSNPDIGEPWHYPNAEDSWTVWFLRPPNGTSITAQTNLHYASYFDTTFMVTVPAGTQFLKWFYEKDGSGVSRIYYTSTLPPDNPNNILNKTHQLLATAGSTFQETAGCNFLGFSLFTDSFGLNARGHANNCRFGGLGGYTSFTMDTPTYTSSGVTISNTFPSVPTPDNICHHSIHLNLNTANKEGYYADIAFFHIGAIRKFQLAIRYNDSTGFAGKVLISNSAVTLTGAFDTSYTWRLERTSDDILILYRDGVEQLRYDLINDLTETSPHTTAPLYTAGTPGLGAFGTTPTEMRITRFSAYRRTDAVPCGPCVPGGGGGGGDPGSEGTTTALVWVMKNGQWRPVPGPAETRDKVQVHAKGVWRPARRGWVMANGVWREMGSDTTFVLDPTLHPDTPGLPCEGVVDPFPDPTPVGDLAFGLYNLTRNLLDVYPPFNGAITGSNRATLSSLLAAIAARSFQLWFVPAFRNEQTTNHSGRGQYDHTATMAKFGTFSGFSDANQGVIPHLIPYDEPDCDLCWLGKPPTVTEVEAGCGLLTSIFGVPCAVRMSPRKMLALGWPCTNVRIGMAQWGGPGGFGVEGFGNDYAGYIAAQIAAATTLGLDGILWGLSPYRDLASGWRTSVWTDAFLETVGLQAAAAGMNYGVYMWLGYPPSTRVLLPATNAKLQIISAAL